MKALSAFLVAASLGAQAPSASGLSQQVIENELRQYRELGDFTFQYESTWKRYSAKGKPEGQGSDSGESYMSRGRNVDIMLVKNGKPLKPANLEKVRAAAIAKLLSDAKSAADKYPLGTLAPDRHGPGMSMYGTRMSVIDILRYCQLAEPKPLDGQIELQFDNCNSPWPQESHFPHLRGTIQVDTKSRVMLSWKAWITSGPFAGALFFEQSSQPAPGGIRVPEYQRMNRAVAPHLFTKDRVEISYRWSKPQRFSVDTNQTIETPKP